MGQTKENAIGLGSIWHGCWHGSPHQHNTRKTHRVRRLDVLLGSNPAEPPADPLLLHPLDDFGLGRRLVLLELLQRQPRPGPPVGRGIGLADRVVVIARELALLLLLLAR